MILNIDVNDARNVINQIPTKVFDSHDFIELFCKLEKQEYIDALKAYQDNNGDGFRTLHQVISNYLERNDVKLNIKRIGTVNSKDVHGNDVPNAQWQKTN